MKLKTVKEEYREDSMSSVSRAGRRQSRAGPAGGVDKKYAVIQCTGYLKSWSVFLCCIIKIHNVLGQLINVE